MRSRIRPPVRQLATVTLFLSATLALAQAPQSKKVLKHSDYEIWNKNSSVNMSRDGKWIAYTINPPEGDSEVVIRSLGSDLEHRIAQGTRAAAAEAETPEGGTAATTPTAPGPVGPRGPRGVGFAPGGAAPQFTPDSKRVLFNHLPTKTEMEQARTEKKSPAESPRPHLAIVDLPSGKVGQKIDRVGTFRIHGEGSGLLVYRKDSRPTMGGGTGGPGAPGTPAAGTPATAPAGAQPPAGPGGPGIRTRGQRPGGPGAPGAAAGGPPGTTPVPTAPRVIYGTELIVRKLSDGSERTFADVLEYTITKDGHELIYTVASRKEETNGVYAVDLNSQAGPFPILAGKGRYSRLTWDDKETRLAFFYDDTPTPTPTPPTPTASAGSPMPPATPAAAAPESPRTPAKWKVFLWERSPRTQVAALPMGGAASSMVTAREAAKPAKELFGPTSAGLPTGMLISGSTLGFSTDGNKLAFGLMPVPEPVKPAPAAPAAPATPGTRAAAAPAEKVELDLWHWKDEMIQPMQKVRGGTERPRSQSAVYFFDSKTIRPLGDENRNVSLPSHGDWSVVSNDKPYRYLTGYGANLNDYALFNIRTGETKPVLTAATGGISTSPKSHAGVTFDGKDWYAISFPSGTKINLTAKLPVKFFDEEHDTPNEAPSYGFSGWTVDEKFVLLNDYYDVWKVAVDGSSATNLTGIGRELKTRLRLLPLPIDDDTTERGVDLSKPHLLSATNLSTHDTGFYRLEAGSKPKLLVMGSRQYGPPIKARNADTYLVTISTFFDSPDYYVTGSDFREFRKVTNLQPKKADYNWGKAELVHYKSLDGIELSGILVKPENFDPSKKYPMIVYIYERLSQEVHRFRLPSAGTSINPTFYASNGYLVFMPDIAYTVGSPGQSALKCVLPAIQAVVDKGSVDEKAIGIQGHSWGGYQIAYMVTQTNRFKAAAAGAPVSNMVSAYGGIRWGTGLPRQFQYERTQSRIGAKLWDTPLKYIENSPIFMADRVQTPLMILHNDQDDAVPWYQGIEYYLALRRLGKECYLFNYNGEFHGLRKKSTQQDYTLRMQQFFDHHLKGAPMPEWMAKGIPFQDRDKEKEQWKGLFKTESK